MPLHLFLATKKRVPVWLLHGVPKVWNPELIVFIYFSYIDSEEMQSGVATMITLTYLLGSVFWGFPKAESKVKKSKAIPVTGCGGL
jgi:hypothetical protein